MNSAARLAKFAAVAVLAVLCAALRSDADPLAMGRAQRLARLPAQTLWAWERGEDLRGIDPARTAIAYLDHTIRIGGDAVTQPRLHALMYPEAAARIAVVRIEVRPGTVLGARQQRQALESLLTTARRPGVAALQVDFDATASQRRFYTELLGALRRRMPATLPLSITALASWCSYDNWIAALPVDEAVPMFFRMGPDSRRAAADLQVREPLCRTSVGVSTGELWPTDFAGKRIYIFPDHGWRQDLPLLAQRTNR